jgi:hypothetical protein
MRRLWKGPDNIERISVLTKYQVALTAAGKPLMEPGTLPYQDAAFLVKLRDRLMHYKPQWQGDDPHELEKKLRNKFLVNQLVPSGPWYPNQCLGAGCAQWARDTAIDLVNTWWESMGIATSLNTALNNWPEP